ncbi:uncharacterized protein PHACADRAFT_253918 [Phanerochaete carnosa HHB-10118-sp]|uniref:Clp1-like protein n=1 Tax=Phanerochaete carnosa (strain HHB-10118-sp) TaxID=650164 RepID=K5V2B2_PHACS|nr:uncharacterized protein PHACADRAFT_253918 [Phanerochaete carnosa HHB-10118-sp]EKM56666.1 hypothetical protein PHACADRAFT_253918 [Phanerochaete carnosa HHB-10118-sp]
MFQLQAQPVPHFAMQSIERATHSAPSPSINMPRTLARPPFMEVDRNTIAALAPELAEVPIEYIRQHLARQAHGMVAAVNLLSIPSSLPKSHLPSALDAPVRPSPSAPASASFPTHVLAVTSTKPSSSSPTTPTAASFAAAQAQSSHTAILYPTHSLVLAAHCANLPSLPPSRPSGRATSLTLPVVPLTVPDATTFPHLHAFLHNKRADALLAALLPSLAQSLPRADGASSSSSSSSASRGGYTAQFTSDRLARLAQHLAAVAHSQAGTQGGLQILMANAKVVTNLWKNTCAFGIFDTELWGVIDLAYEILLTALNRMARQ